MNIQYIHLLIVFIICFVLVGCYAIYELEKHYGRPTNRAIELAAMSGIIFYMIIFSLLHYVSKTFKLKKKVIKGGPFAPAINKAIKKLHKPIFKMINQDKTEKLGSSIRYEKP